MQLERHALFWTISALVFIYLVQLLAPVLLPFVVGLTLAYFFTPVVDLLARVGLPRWASAILLLALSVLVIVLALIFILPVIAQQVAQLLEAAPREIVRLKTFVADVARDHLGARYPQAEAGVDAALDSFSASIPGLLAGVATTLWNQSAAAFNFISLLLVTPLVFFYALIDWPKMVAKLDSLLPRDEADELRKVATEISERVSAFIRGQGAVCLILAIYYSVALSLAGLNYGLLIGLLTGFAAFIPVIGWWIGAIPAVTLAAVQFWPDVWYVAIIVAIMLIGEALESGVLAPNIIGSEVELHPIWVIFALLAFGYLFGFLGLLVAVPVSAAIGVLVRYGLRTYLASSIYRGGESAENQS
jgi:predicted PurR-regulated permease PerM